MSDSAHTPLTDESFERALLDAGRREALPTPNERAWQQFAGSLTTLASIATSSSLITFAPARPLLARAQHSIALKYLLLGAVLGSLGTWIWLDARLAARVAAARTASAASVPGPRLVAAPRSANASTPATAIRNDELPSSSSRTRALHEHLGTRNPNPRASAPSPSAPAISTLAAEVAALDAARAAAQRGDSDEALRRIARYHEAFPTGVLSADADAAAIETLSAAGRSVEAARLAAQFLVSHPNDPHTAAVRRSLHE